ncbi:MAG: prepilin-type N-terminal cleavage/methylation domain-containing protein [Pseudomonadota bacterium]
MRTTKQGQTGFTLMEMIGVVAVIAILAAMATPMIFDAILDARVSAVLQQARTLETAAARYYTDTGQWPRQRNPVASSWERQLTSNLSSSGGTVSGWQGPYIESDITNPISQSSEAIIFNEWRAAGQCDLDGDGNVEGDFLIYRLRGISNDVARKISDAIDGDGAVTSGTEAWNLAGKVRLNGSSLSTDYLIICLTATS